MICIRLKYCLLSLFFIIIVSSTDAQWEQIFEKEDSTWSFKDLHFFDQDTGVAIAVTNSLSQLPMGSFVLNTNDGGQTWDTSNFIQDTVFLSINFPERNIGYIACKSPPNSEISVFKSTNGGLDWNYKSFIVVGNPLDMSINFYNDSVGVFSGQGYSSITYDGGQAWTQISSIGSVNTSLLGGFLLMTDGNGYIYSYDTLNNYNTYSIFNSGTVTSHTIDIINGDTLLTVTALGNNGGDHGYPYFNFGMIATGNFQTNSYSILHFPYQRPRTLARTESGFLYAGTFDTEGYDKRFLKSIDNGQTWYSQQVNESQLPPTTTIKNMQCVNDTVCFATSGPVIYKTTNGGGALIEQVGFAYSDIEENIMEKGGVSIYPNPAENDLYVKSTTEIQKISIYSYTGQEVYRSNIDSFEVSMPLNQLGTGIYLIQVKTKDGIQVRKFVKQ